MPADREPLRAHLGEGQLGGADRPPLERGVHDVEADPLGREQPPALLRLGHAPLAQVDVVPSGEQVLPVPRALAVADQDEGAHRPERFDA